MSAKLARVTRRNPCSVCSHTDWCGYSESFVICMRVRSERKAKNGGYIHPLNGAVKFIPQTPSIPRASIQQRNAIYNKLLLDHLILSNTHAWALGQRGLSVESIEENCYRSVPAFGFGCFIARRLAEDNLRGVPGFYRKDEEWRMSSPGSGIFIPVRDSHSRIQALQIRLDEGDPKYIWLSSRHVSSGAPVHFSSPARIRRTGEAVLTEGALKADLISQFLKVGSIGLAGVSTFSQGFGLNLKRAFPELKTIHIAFDSDFKEKEQVRNQLFRLITELRRTLFEVRILTWDGHKGLDDLLAA